MAASIRLRRGLESARSGVTPAAGELLYTTDQKKLFIGDGSTAGGLKFSVSFTIPHTYAISGSISGSTVVVPFTFILSSGQVATLKNVRASINSGTSISMAVRKNGSGIGGLTAVSVTTTPGNTAPSSTTTFATNDELDLVFSSPSGSPSDISVTLEIEYKQDIVAG